MAFEAYKNLIYLLQLELKGLGGMVKGYYVCKACFLFNI